MDFQTVKCDTWYKVINSAGDNIAQFRSETDANSFTADKQARLDSKPFVYEVCGILAPTSMHDIHLKQMRISGFCVESLSTDELILRQGNAALVIKATDGGLQCKYYPTPYHYGNYHTGMEYFHVKISSQHDYGYLCTSQAGKQMVINGGQSRLRIDVCSVRFQIRGTIGGIFLTHQGAQNQIDKLQIVEETSCG